MTETTETERYTLAEAQQELRRRQCLATGHDWDIISTHGGSPVKIVCGGCGWGGSVTMGERP